MHDWWFLLMGGEFKQSPYSLRWTNIPTMQITPYLIMFIIQENSRTMPTRLNVLVNVLDSFD